MRKPAVIVFVFALLLTGCSGSETIGTANRFGNVVISADFESLDQGVTYIDIEIANESAFHTGVLTKEKPNVNFVSLPEGLWNVTALAKDVNGEISYHSMSIFKIVDNSTENVGLLLRPLNDTLGHINLTVKRDPSTISNSETNRTVESVFIQIFEKPGFYPTYQIIKKIDTDISDSTFTLHVQLPTKKNYQVTALITGDNNEFIEVGESIEFILPANDIINSITIPMSRPTYKVAFPDKLHSGNDTRQIDTIVTGPLSGLGFVYVWIGLNPWEENGVHGLWSTNKEGTGWIVNAIEGTFPKVTKPTKLYYQVGVAPFRYLLPDITNWPFHYEPNLKKGEELPYVWLYP